MMLDRLAREEQPPGDLGVGQSLAEQGEHFLLTPGQPSDVLWPGPGRFHAELAHQRGCGVRVAAGPQIFEDRQRRPCLSSGYLTVARREHLGEQ